MDREPRLQLIPDWPRIRERVAKRLGKTEQEIDAMASDGSSLDQLELVMTVEELFGPEVLHF